MHLPVGIGYRVVDYLMSKLAVQPFVGLQRIAIECRSRFHVVAHQRKAQVISDGETPALLKYLKESLDELDVLRANGLKKGLA